MGESSVNELFYDEPAGAFSEGHVFPSAPNLTSAIDDPDNGYWHCDIADQDTLAWSSKVYELFGLSPGAPIEREWAVARYSERSRAALEQIRTLGVNRKTGFILDAEIDLDGLKSRWIRVLAVPLIRDGRVVGLHGLKRAL